MSKICDVCEHVLEPGENFATKATASIRVHEACSLTATIEIDGGNYGLCKVCLQRAADTSVIEARSILSLFEVTRFAGLPSFAVLDTTN